jgi:hypothetical protein
MLSFGLHQHQKRRAADAVLMTPLTKTLKVMGGITLKASSVANVHWPHFQRMTFQTPSENTTRVNGSVYVDVSKRNFIVGCVPLR